MAPRVRVGGAALGAGGRIGDSARGSGASARQKRSMLRDAGVVVAFLALTSPLRATVAYCLQASSPLSPMMTREPSVRLQRPAVASAPRLGHGFFPVTARARRSLRLALRMRSDDPWTIDEAQLKSLDQVGKKKVAIVGSGAVGLYCGARLLEAGHDVTFLVRLELEHLQTNGLTVESIDGDAHFDSVKAVGSTAEIGEVDWVLLCLKTSSLKAAPKLLEPLVNKDTRILAVMNGFGIEEKLSETFPEEQIFGGMAYMASYRENHVVKHVKVGPIMGGHMRNDRSELEELKSLFYGSKVKMMASNNLRMARWWASMPRAH
jgi:hypothetical protein